MNACARFVVACWLTACLLLLSTSASGQQPQQVAPDFDYTRLAHPEVASRLNLTDEQRVQIVQLIDARAVAVGQAKVEDREKVTADSNQMLFGILTKSQQARLLSLTVQQKLRFQFREQKWNDVLSWFATQARLSLVVNTPPAGTFTYSDTEAYTPIEAIDLLNGVLMTKGFTLIRRGRMLICLDVSGDIPADLIPRVKLEDLNQYGKFELVTVAFPLGSRPAQIVSGEITPLLGQHGDSVALPQTKQLIVTDTAGKMRVISAVIGSIPEPKRSTSKPSPPPPKPVLAFHAFESLDPDAAVETLRQLIDGAAFYIDRTAGQINIYGTPSQQTAAKTALDQMMANATSDKRMRIETYRVRQGTELKIVQDQLKLAIPDIQISADQKLHRLVIYTSPEGHARVVEILKKLRAATGDSEPGQVLVHRLRKADPAAIMPILKALAPEAQITSDAANGQIVARGNPADLLVIRQLLSKIDAPQDGPDGLSLQFYGLSLPGADDLAKTLKTMAPRAQITWQNQARRFSVLAAVDDHIRIKRIIDQFQSGQADEQKSQLTIYPITATERRLFQAVQPSLAAELAGIKIISDADTDPGELAIWARPSQHEIIKQLLDQLRQDVGKREARTLAAYPVAQSNVADLLTLLEELYPNTKFLHRANSDRLLVWAPAEEHARIGASLRELQASLPAEQQGRFESYPIQGISAGEAQKIVQPLAPNVRFSVDSQQNRLIVWGTPRDQKVVQSALSRIAPSQRDASFQLVIYPVDKGDPNSLLEVLKQLFPGTKIVLDERTGRLMVWANDEVQLRVKRAVEQLDAPARPGTIEKLVSYAVGDINPDPLLPLLKQLAPNTTLVSDRNARVILAWGSARDHEVLAKTIDQLRRQGSDGPRSLVVYPTGRRDPQELRGLLTELAPSATVIADVAGRRVAAYAGKTEQDAIKDAVRQFTGLAGDGEQGSLVVYRLVKTGAANAQPVLESMIPDAQLSVGVRPGQLIAWATPADHEKLRAAVEQLESQGPSEPGQVLVHRLRKADPAAIMPILKALAPEAQITSDAANGQIVARGNPADLLVIRQLLSKIDAPQDGPDGLSLQFYGLSLPGADDLAKTLKTMAPRAQITWQNQARRFSVLAAVDDHIRIKRIIDQFQSGQADEQKSQLTIYPITATERRLFQAVQPSLAAELAGIKIISDADTDPGELAIWARPSQHEIIKQLLDQLRQDVGKREARTLAAYPVAQSNVADLLTLLEELYPNTKFLHRANSDRLLVWAPAEEHARIGASLRELQASLPAEQQGRFESYPIQGISAGEAQKIVQPLAPNVRFSVDSQQNRLIVWGTPRDQKVVQSALSRIAPSQRDASFQLVIYPVDKGDPNSLLEVLKQLFPGTKIVLDERTGRLMVWANDEVQLRVKRAVEQLDAPARPGTIEKLVSYAVGDINPDPLLPLLKQLAPNTTLVSDRNARVILAWGSARDHEVLAKTIDQLRRQGSDGPRSLVVYPTGRRDPQELRGLLTELAPSATVIADVAGRRVAAYAGKTEQDAIKDAVRQFTGLAGDGEQGSLVVYRLVKTGAANAQPVLESMIPDAQLSVGVRPGQLIAWATPADHEKLRAAVEQLESQGPAAAGMGLRVYEVSREVADSAGGVLRVIDPGIRMVSVADPKKLVVWASPESHQLIQQTLDVLKESLGAGKRRRVVKAYELKSASPGDARRTLSDVVPEITYLSSRDARRLVIWAEPERHEELEKLLAQLDEVLPPDQQTELRVYPLKDLDPSAVIAALDRKLTVDASIIPNARRKSLIVRASPQRHTAIKAAIDELVSNLPEIDRPVSRVYRFQTGDPQTAQQVLSQLLPSATLVADTDKRILVATALPEDHDKIAATVEQLDADPDETLQTRVYPLTDADPRTAGAALAKLLPRATFSPDAASRILLATASEADHEKIKATVDQMNGGADGELETRVYPLIEGDPAAAVQALSRLLPNVTFAADANGRTFLATASAKDHEKIKSAADQLDRSESSRAQMKTYVVQRADPQAVYRALRTMYRRDRSVGLSYDPEGRMIMAVTHSRQHETIDNIIQQFESSAGRASGATLETYSLKNVDSQAVQPALEVLLRNQNPKVELNVDRVANHLMVVALPQQHQLIRNALGNLRTEERVLEVLQLQQVEPETAERAIDNLFMDEPIAATPTIDSDRDTQQLFVRATHEQLTMIRQLLAKMGEIGLRDSARGNTRVVPFPGDTRQLLEQIQRMWPQLRTNPIRVLSPAGTGPAPPPRLPLNQPGNRSPGGDDSDDTPPAQGARNINPPRHSDTENQTVLASAAPGQVPNATDPSAKEQAPTGSPHPAESPASKSQPPNESDARPPETGQTETGPPVFVVPGEGRVTILSDDTEALNQLESLLRALASRRGAVGGVGNYIIVPLHNTGAASIANLLEELFRQTSRGEPGNANRVAIVADERLNVIVVHGSRTDRAMVKNLVRMLDSSNLPESHASSPQIIPLKYTSAERVETILRAVYRTHLTAGGSHTRIRIPEGVPQRVTDVLRQLSASSAGPLLTLEIDRLTNSIIVLAPQQLSREVAALVQRLDSSAKDGASGRIRIIPLEEVNSEQMSQALDLLLERRTSGRSSRRSSRRSR